MTREQVAEMLAVKPDWVSLMIGRAELPFVLVGKGDRIDDYRIRRDELLAWMTENDARMRRKLGPISESR